MQPDHERPHMPVFEFDIFTNAATGQALTVGDPQPYLHQVALDPDHNNIRQYWLRTGLHNNIRAGVSPNLILSRTFSYAIDVVGAVFGDGQLLQQHGVNSGPNQLWDWSVELPNRGRIIQCTDPNTGINYAIDAPDGKPDRDPHIWKTHKALNQQWIPVPEQHVFTAFKIRSLKSQKVVDVPAGSQAPGVNIQQFRDVGLICFNQYWRLLDPANDQAEVAFGDKASVRIQSLCNGLFLQPVSTDGASLIVQAAESGQDDQVWQLFGNNAGFTIRPARNNKLALDLPDGGTDDHIPIQVYPDNGGSANQQWS